MDMVAERVQPAAKKKKTSLSCCVGFVHSVQVLCACSKLSSRFLVYLCGRITGPHTGLACILHCFE